MKKYLSTKEFADLCKTTKRTIMHYDQIGLLKPTKREKFNRYYTPRQVLKFEKLALLQSVGFSLKEIKQKIENHQSLIKIFKENKQKIAEKLRKINAQMKKIDEILINLEKNSNILDPIFKTIKPYDFYAITKEGRYANIPSYCKELAKKIGDRDFSFTYFVIFKDYYKSEYSPVKSTIIIGAKAPNAFSLLPKKNVDILYTPQHKALTSLHKGSHASLGYVWKHMWEYFQKNELIHNQAILVREVYNLGPENEKYEENYVTELQVPIISKS